MQENLEKNEKRKTIRELPKIRKSVSVAPNTTNSAKRPRSTTHSAHSLNIQSLNLARSRSSFPPLIPSIRIGSLDPMEPEIPNAWSKSTRPCSFSARSLDARAPLFPRIASM